MHISRDLVKRSTARSGRPSLVPQKPGPPSAARGRGEGGAGLFLAVVWASSLAGEGEAADFSVVFHWSKAVILLNLCVTLPGFSFFFRLERALFGGSSMCVRSCMRVHVFHMCTYIHICVRIWSLHVVWGGSCS